MFVSCLSFIIFTVCGKEFHYCKKFLQVAETVEILSSIFFRQTTFIIVLSQSVQCMFFFSISNEHQLLNASSTDSVSVCFDDVQIPSYGILSAWRINLIHCVQLTAFF